MYWVGICSAGVYSTSPFSFIHAGRGPLTLGCVSQGQEQYSPTDLGGPLGKRNYMIQRLVDAKDLEASLASPAEIQKAQLLKLVVNAVINPLTAIFDCKNGQLLDQGPRLNLMETLLQEIAPVVRALLLADGQGVDNVFSNDSLLQLVLRVAEKTGENTSSMLQDTHAGSGPRLITSTALSSRRRRGWSSLVPTTRDSSTWCNRNVSSLTLPLGTSFRGLR